MFLSRTFSIALLVAHGALLTVFLATRWLRPSGASLPGAFQQLFRPPPKTVRARIASKVTPDFVLMSVLSAMIVGCLCARSLHYQFFAYIAWSSPYLLWRSGLHPVLVYVVWAAQEWAWNVYPSTSASSMVVVGSLAVTAFAAWWGAAGESTTQPPTAGHPHRD